MATRVIAAQDKTSSGAGDDVQIKAGNANTSGAGGSIIFQPGVQATTGGNGTINFNDTSGNPVAKLSTDSNYLTVTPQSSKGFRIINSTSSTIFTVTNGIPDFPFGAGFNSQAVANVGSIYNAGYAQMLVINPKLQWPTNTPTSAIENGSVGQIKVTDGSTGGGSFAYTSATPTALSTNPTNDLVLTGSAFQRLSSSSALSVTGIAPPATGSHVDGRLIWLYNVGSFNITLKHSQTSTAANQFINEGSGDIVLGPGRMVQAIYDSTSSKWRVNGETYPYVFPTTDGTNGQVLTTNGSGTLSWATVSAGASASGTTNYIAKFTGTSTLGNSLIYDDGSNIGIGTTTTNPLGNGGSNRTIAIQNGSGNVGISLVTSATTDGSTIGFINFGSTSASTNKNGASINAELEGAVTTDANTRLAFYTRGSGTQAERLRITGSGNVGIGTASPTQRLHVVADSSLTNPEADIGVYAFFLNSNATTNAGSAIGLGANNNAGALIVGQRVGANNESVMKFQTRNSAGTSATRMTIASNGWVGIGTTTPQMAFDVTGAGRFGTGGSTSGSLLNITGGAYNQFNLSSGSGWGLLMGHGDGSQTGNYHGTNVAAIINVSAAALHLGTSNTSRMMIDSAGNVGINNTSPGAKLQIDTGATGTKGQIIKAFLGQSANLSEWQNSSGTVNSWINSSGNEFSTNGINLTSYTTSYIKFDTSGQGLYRTNSWMGVGGADFGSGFFIEASNYGRPNIRSGYPAGNGDKAIVFNTTTSLASSLSRIATFENNGTIGAYILRDGDGVFSGVRVGTGASGTGNAILGGNSNSVNTGNYNTLIGWEALYNKVAGANNVALGADAGYFQADGSTALTTTNNSIYIGTLCRGFSNSDSNSIVIGYQAIGKGANTTVIGNSNTVSTDVFGTLTTTLGAAAQKGLVVKGAATQSANLTEWQDSTGTVVAAVSPTGAFTGSSFTPYGTFNSTTTIFGNNYWTPNYTGGVTSPSAGTYTKSTGSNASWDAQVYSTEGYTKNVYCSARASQTTGYVMFGLNEDTANSSYNTIDYAWFFDQSGILTIYENGTLVNSYGTYTTSTVLSITYDGSNVQYWKDGVIQRTVARSTGNPLYFDTSFYNLNAAINNVQFGPIGQPFGISGTAGYHPKFTSQQTLGNSIVYDNGTNVGIGTTNNLSDTVNIYQTAAPIIRFQTSGNQYGARIGFWTGIGMQIQCASANFPIVFQTAGTSNDAGFERMRITHDGLIGIGTASPGGLLDVQQSNAGDMLVRAWNTNTAGTGKSIIRVANSGNNAQGQQIQFSDNNYYTGTVSSDRTNGMSFYVGQMATPLTSERVRIDTSGNVGVGAGARIGSGTGYINAGATAAGYLELYNATSGATTLMNTGAFNVLVGTNNTERIRVTSSGLVGIGTSTIAGNNPLADLHVNDASGYGSLQLSQSPAGATIDTGGEIQFAATYRSTSDLTQVARIRGLRENATNNNWAGYLAFYTSTGSDNPSASTERMRINSSGNVGIGTASPSFRLQVDAASVDANIVANVTSGYGGIGVYAAGTNKVILGYAGANANYGSQTIAGDIALKTNNSNLHITTGSGNSVTTAYFSSAGNVGIGNVSPGARLQVDTGATGTKGQIIKAVASQTANLSEWQNSSGTVLTTIDSAGRIGVGTSTDSNYSIKTASKIYAGHDIVTTNGLVTLSGAYDFTFGYGGPYIRRGAGANGATLLFGEDGLNQAAFDFSLTATMSSVGLMRVTASSASTKALIVRAAAFQTANLQEWQNSSNTALAYMDANGNFAAVTKSFIIPHPTPAKAAEGKKLRYASLEGPENGVYFRGRLEGENVIILPDYWVDLVDPDSITVNLTARKFAQPSLFVVDANAERVVIESDRQVCCDFIVYATRKDIAKLEVEPDGN